MSFHRENVTWQAENGTWWIGFYQVIEPAWEDQGEDYDPEWDVDHDHSRFESVYTGTSQAEAWDAVDADGIPNPGGSLILRYEPENLDRIAQLDQMATDAAQAALDRRAEAEAVGMNYHGWIPQPQ